MSDSFGSRGWEQPGINPFEVLQSHIAKNLKKKDEATAAVQPAAKEEPPSRFDPFRRGIQMAAENKSHAESVRRNAEAVQVYTEHRVQPHRVEPNTPGVDSKKGPGKSARTGPTRVRPGQGQSEYGTPQPKPSGPRRIPRRGPQ